MNTEAFHYLLLFMYSERDANLLFYRYLLFLELLLSTFKVTIYISIIENFDYKHN